MKKLITAMFIFLSCFTSKAFSDGHAIKMGIIFGSTHARPKIPPSRDFDLQGMQNSFGREGKQKYSKTKKMFLEVVTFN